MLDAARLRQLLWYEPETGVFVRLVRTTNSVQVGDVVSGSSNGKGYLQIRIDGRKYRSHRLAWLYMTGEWPDYELDHVDGNKGNNAWTNLRPSTRSLNLQNLKKALKNNRLQLLGVTQTSRSCYIARINVKGDRRYLGAFPSALAAHEAYLSAKRQLHEGNTI